MFDIRDLLTPRRVINAMWDFSWMLSHYEGGPFEDFDKVTDELLERGFNTVRIDCFPWIVGHLKSDDEAITIPGNPNWTWGYSDIDRKHRPLEELLEFAGILKKKGIYLILSSWGVECPEYTSPGKVDYREDEAIFRHGWEKILNALAGIGFQDNILYVDLDQEFPCCSRYFKKFEELAGAIAKSGSANLDDSMEEAAKLKNKRGPLWNDAQMDFAYNIFIENLKHFQKLYPELRFTYSFHTYWDEIRSMKLNVFDVLEVHTFMHCHRFDNRTDFGALAKVREEHDYSDHQSRIEKTLKSVRPMLLGEMRNRMAFASEWARETAAPVITTEAWGPWWHMDNPHLDWDWLKDWCEECMRMAAEYGFWGVTPWNYSHPYWNNWSDIKWYRKVNEAFLKS